MKHLLQRWSGTVPDQWLLLLAQLPAAPSSARVALWRRLRAAGAAGVHNGAWILPSSEDHAKLFTQLAETVRQQGGSAALFTITALNQSEQDAVLARLRSDRAREYDEFTERTGGFFAEIDKETQLQKFTFAELEEIEGDLEKLSTWLGKIRKRDFFPDNRLKEADATLESCRTALQAFAEKVYRQDGIADSLDDTPAYSEGRHG